MEAAATSICCWLGLSASESFASAAQTVILFSAFVFVCTLDTQNIKMSQRSSLCRKKGDETLYLPSLEEHLPTNQIESPVIVHTGREKEVQCVNICKDPVFQLRAADWC